MINNEAKKFGVEFLHENVANINAHLKNLTSVNPDIKFTLDFKHSIAAGFDICDTIDAMGKNIAHVHLNDMMIENSTQTVSKTEMCRLPFYGNLDYTKIFKKLREINYNGSFITEVYRYNYKNDDEIKESKKRVEDFLKSWESDVVRGIVLPAFEKSYAKYPTAKQ